MTSLATTLLINSLSEQKTTPLPVMELRPITQPESMCDHSSIIFNKGRHRANRKTKSFLNDQDKMRHPPVIPMSSSKSEGPFWQSIDNCLESESEKIVIYCFLIYGMSNYEILSMYPSKFSNVEQVAEIKRKVLLSIS